MCISTCQYIPNGSSGLNVYEYYYVGLCPQSPVAIIAKQTLHWCCRDMVSLTENESSATISNVIALLR